MSDTVITRTNALGSDQPEQLIFTNRRRHPISNVKIPGVHPSDNDHVDIPGVDIQDVDNIDIPVVDANIQKPQVI